MRSEDSATEADIRKIGLVAEGYQFEFLEWKRELATLVPLRKTLNPLNLQWPTAEESCMNG